MEQQLKALLESLKELKAATEKWTLRNANVGKSLAAFFASDDSLKQPSNRFSEAMTRGHEVVQVSSCKYLEDKAIAPINAILTTTFPDIKSKISKRDGYLTDLHSYQRRVANLRAKNIPENDPELIKLTDKKSRALREFSEAHETLKDEIYALYENRHLMMRPHFVVIAACQGELQSQLAADFNQMLKDIDNGDVKPIRNEISNLIASGGPPKYENESKGAFGIFRTSVKQNSDLGIASPENTQKKTLSPSTSSSSSRSSFGTASNSVTASTSKPANVSPPAKPLPQIPAATSSSNAAATAAASSPFGSFNPFSILSDWSSQTPLPPPPKETKPVPRNSESRSSSIASDAQNRPLPPSVPSQQQKTIAMYDYDGVDKGDLSFRKGDVILVTEKIDAGWWRGTRIADGSFGMFPVSSIDYIFCL